MLLFRQKYRLPPNDPRLLRLTREQVELDLELDLAARDDAQAQQCEGCGGWTYFPRCPLCPGHPPLSLLERLIEREERGERIDWFKEYDAVVWGDRVTDG